MSAELVFCPFCKVGHSLEKKDGFFTCPKLDRKFNLAMSLEAIKDGKYK